MAVPGVAPLAAYTKAGQQRVMFFAPGGAAIGDALCSRASAHAVATLGAVVVPAGDSIIHPPPSARQAHASWRRSLLVRSGQGHNLMAVVTVEESTPGNM